jgi:beta-phosphoglucomutase
MLAAIVFDFDGVIADTEPLHLAGFRDVLAARGLALTDAEYYDRYLGYDDAGAFRAMGADRGRPWDDADVRELVVEKAERLRHLTAHLRLLFPGAADAIRRAAAHVPIAIASGALRHEVTGVLVREGLAELFTVIVAAEDVGRSKPSPDPYAAAVARLGSSTGRPIAPPQCVAIEDSLWGLQSAKAAGLRTVAVGQTYRAAELAADLVLPGLGDLDMPALEALIAAREGGADPPR